MMHLFDFLRGMFPMAQPPAAPAIKPLRKPRAKKPTTKKNPAAVLKKKPSRKVK